MKKELYFDRYCGLQISALAEDGKLIELGIENESHRDLVGNIYKGKVVNIIESMNAAFIACGLERNCFLPLSGGETIVDPSNYESQGSCQQNPEKLQLKEGDEIVVQILKNPRGSKGAKVTTKLSFVGKNLIFLPETDFLGISRKIREAELRDNLLFTVDGLRGRGNGLIVRTVAPFTTLSRLKAEVAYLKNTYESVLEHKKNAQVGDVLYREYELPVRVMRDSFNDDIEKIYVGNAKLYERLVELIRLRPDFDANNITLYQGERGMLSYYGLTPQIKEISGAKINLPNGANLVIEHTEAMTVVDVNTGKFIGNENLEDTVYATNIAAAREIARQVRLRDIGGIVTVDFIDMVNPKHRQAVMAELNQSLSFDRAKCKVLPMNDLCLGTFTRKRISNGVEAQLLQPCSHCHQSGYILSNEFIVCLIRAEMLDKLAENLGMVVVELNRGIMEYIFKNKLYEADPRMSDRCPVYFVPHRTYHEEQFKVYILGEGEEYKLPEDAVKLEF